MAAPVRVGWLSTAKIGRKNSWALKLSGNGVPAVVGSRDLARAEAYAAEWGFESGAKGSYEEVVADPTVDAVYIPLPTALRAGWALKAVAAGKHVLMDKPCATSLAELQAVTSACKRQGLQFQDGVMFMHHERQVALAKYLHAGEDGPLGRLCHVASVFGFNATAEWMGSDIRVDPALEPAGCLGDLAWYSIRWTLFAFQWEVPSHASCTVHRWSAKGVPTETTVTLFYPDGRTGVFTNGFHFAFRQAVEVTGTKGTLALDDFVLSRDTAAFTVYEAPGMEDCDRVVSMPATRVEVPTAHGHQESRMWRNFCGLVRSGARERFWPEVALKTQAVLDACLLSAQGREAAKVRVEPIGDDY